MDELGIWALKGDETEEVETVDAVSKADLAERRLEEALVRRPDMLESGIQLVGRQTPTAGGPLDLLGVDTKGLLVVFELKRHAITRDAVAQCIDYASALNVMDPEELATHIADHSGKNGIEKIDDFKAWYKKEAEENEFEKELSNLLPPRLVLVGLGIDHSAERMARLLQDYGVNISVLTFYGFQHGGETLLARQVEVEVDHTPSSSKGKKSAEKQLYREFWTEFLTEFGQSHKDWKFHRESRGARALTNSLLEFDACEKSKDEMSYSFQYPAVEEWPTRVNFWVKNSNLEDGERILGGLSAQKDEIERSFGEPLSWDIGKGRKTRGIYIQHPAERLAIGDRERWPEVRDWAIKRLGALRAAIQPHLDELTADDE